MSRHDAGPYRKRAMFGYGMHMHQRRRARGPRPEGRSRMPRRRPHVSKFTCCCPARKGELRSHTVSITYGRQAEASMQSHCRVQCIAAGTAAAREPASLRA